MKTKPNIKKIIQNIKNEKKVEKRNPQPMRLDIDYTQPLIRSRDMRQEAMDMGCHGAQEMWGAGDQQ